MTVLVLRKQAPLVRDGITAIERTTAAETSPTVEHDDSDITPEPDSTEAEDDDGSRVDSQRSISILVNQSWTSNTDDHVPNRRDPVLSSCIAGEYSSAGSGAGPTSPGDPLTLTVEAERTERPSSSASQSSAFFPDHTEP